MLDTSRIEVICFDVFGTVFDLNAAPKEERIAYAKHISQPDWSPLRLPESWKKLPAHPDSKEGIDRLRQKYVVVTCSNGPLGLLTYLSKHNHISWDAIVPLELGRAFKPRLEAYQTVLNALEIDPSVALMVTANEHFGDLEASVKVGMQSILIRTPTLPTIPSLAGLLGC